MSSFKTIIMNELKNMFKTWYMLVLGLILVILFLSIKRNNKVAYIKEKPKAVAINYTYNKETIHKDEYVSDVYAGRTDQVKNAEYNSLGLPKERYWMTSSEWHGKHIKNMPINNAKKIANGILRLGFLASSDIVLIASNPKYPMAAIAEY